MTGGSDRSHDRTMMHKIVVYNAVFETVCNNLQVYIQTETYGNLDLGNVMQRFYRLAWGSRHFH